MKIKIEHVIILVATILSIYLVSPLFANGIHMNIDSSCHYLRAWCLQEDASVPNNWCNYWQAGVPSSQYYYPPIDILIHLLSKILSLELAYKLIVVLALFAPAIGAYVFLHTVGKPLAGAIAYAFLLLHKGSWHIGGFEETLLVGMWPYVMTVGFWLICTALYLKYIETPSKKNLILAAAFTPFLTHPITLVFSAITYIGITAYKYKEAIKKYKELLTFFLLSALLNAYYIIPFLLKREYFPSKLGGGLDWNLFYNYMISSIPWWVIVLSIIGLFVALKSNDKNVKSAGVIGAIVLFVVAINFTSIDIFRIGGLRLGGYFSSVVYIFAAYSIAVISNIKITKSGDGKLLALAILIFTIFTLFSATEQQSKGILLSSMEPFSDQLELYSFLKELPDGRVLAEETLYNAGGSALSFTHAHCMLPVITNKELIGSGLVIFPRNYTILDRVWASSKGRIFDIDISTAKEKEVSGRIKDYNVKYVIAHTQDYASYFLNHSTGYKVFGNLILFDTGINSTYFEIIDGKIISSNYEKRSAEADIQITKPTKLIFKVNPYSNWKAELNGKELEIQDCNGLICVDANESGTIKFKYSLLKTDILGYIITAITIIAMIFVIKKKSAN